MINPELAMIRMDIENARSSANQLRSVAEECTQSERIARTAYNGFSGYWRGQSADAFSQEFQAWITETNRIGQEIRDLSARLLRTVRDFEAAEERIKAEVSSMGSRLSGGGIASGVSEVLGESGSFGGGFR